MQLEGDVKRHTGGGGDHHAPPSALNRTSTEYSGACPVSRSNQPCAAMIATAEGGKMIDCRRIRKGRP